jgi:hypothetical protein
LIDRNMCCHSRVVCELLTVIIRAFTFDHPPSLSFCVCVCVSLLLSFYYSFDALNRFFATQFLKVN